MKFTIGFRSFPTKGKALEEIRRVLNAVELESRLNGDDHVLISELFALHPHASEKATGGVTGFMVRINDYHGALTRGFHVIHDDGSATPFSYAPCMNPAASEPSMSSAARGAIMAGQRELLRNAFHNREIAPCSYCGAQLTKEKGQIHHEAPKFRDLLKLFCDFHGEPKIISNVFGLGDVFADPLVRLDWIKFHDTNAKRVLVCSTCNYADERRAK